MSRGGLLIWGQTQGSAGGPEACLPAAAAPGPALSPLSVHTQSNPDSRLRSQALGCHNNRIPAVKIVTYFLFNFFCSWRKRKFVSSLFPFRGLLWVPC